MTVPAIARGSEAWDGESERIDTVLAKLALARSRSHAAELIQRGDALVDGVTVSKAGQRVRPGQRVSVAHDDPYVSRGAHKLIAALSVFDIDPAGTLALDVGASTGGFTQVLLERGARLVIALDVGHGQLADSIRGDARVRVVEGCNARFLTPSQLAEMSGVPDPPELIVGDLSFISLTMILPALARVAAPSAEVVLLIKPQFEVGRDGIRDGIVVDPGLRAEAVRRVIGCAAEVGFGTAGLVQSPIAGANGNREYLVNMSRGTDRDPTQWEGTIDAVTTDESTKKAGGV